jgi:steroid 5-alpha reductase family enzyme
MFTALFVLLACFTLLWLISLRLRDASIVDLFWGPAFAVAAGVYFIGADGWLPRRVLVLGLVTLWGARLALHLALRNLGQGEDARYRRWREQHGARWWWRSLLQVFLLQAVIAWVVSWPLAAAQAGDGPTGWTAWDLAGTLVVLTGLAIETIADAQLRRFKADPESRGRVLDTGLWRYSRHPNYFGDAVVWWGLYLLAVGVPGGWVTMVSPIVMTWLLRRVSGVPLLEAGMRETRPGYAAYVARTSSFIPWPPRSPGTVDQSPT